MAQRAIFAGLCLALLSADSARAKLTLLAHRGASMQAPENTLASFNKAKTVADFVEFDVRATADGQLVVIHDSSVDRTSNGKGDVSSLTLAQIRALDAGSWFGAAFAGEKIPTAEETLRAIQTDAAPLMERKAGTVAQFVDLLNRVPLRPEGIVYSADYTFLTELKKAKPEVQLGWLGTDSLTANQITQAVADGITYFAWSYASLPQETIDLIHQSGGLVFAWTINDLGTTSALNDRGVDGIITDHSIEYSAESMFACPLASDQVHPQNQMILRQGGSGMLSAALGHLGRYVQWHRAGDNQVLGTGTHFLFNADNAQCYGRYVASWNQDGTTVSAEYDVSAGATDNRLVNISARMTVGPGEAVGIVGFVVKSASTPRFMLRAIGPSLASFGVSGAVSQPSLTVYQRTTAIDSDSIGSRILATAQDFQRNGAFPLSASSGDVAIMKDLPGGAYTALLSSRNNETGVGLIEVYQDNTDANWAAGAPVNLSLRGRAIPDSPLIGGFVVPAGSSQTVLVRGVGPSLGKFGISEPLRDPTLKIYDSHGVIVAENDDWWADGETTLIKNLSNATGAFKLTAGREAGMLVTLTPGAYTALLTDASNTRSGVGLLEIYAINTDAVNLAR